MLFNVDPVNKYYHYFYSYKTHQLFMYYSTLTMSIDPKIIFDSYKTQLLFMCYSTLTTSINPKIIFDSYKTVQLIMSETQRRPGSSPSSFFVGMGSFDRSDKSLSNKSFAPPVWLNRDRSMMILGLNSKSKKCAIDSNEVRGRALHISSNF